MYLCAPPLLFWRGPPQSNCPPDLVPCPVFIRVMVRFKFKKERCFIVLRRYVGVPPTLHNFKFKSGSSYSKAPRGLFVQVWEGRIFTAIAISPGLSSRQSLSRSTFRAGLNSPDTILLLLWSLKETEIFLLSSLNRLRVQTISFSRNFGILAYSRWGFVSHSAFFPSFLIVSKDICS